MFDQVLALVRDHIGNNPEISQAIPSDKADAVHHEVAAQINNGLKSQASAQGGAGGLLSMLAGSMGSGNAVTNAISGGVVGALGSKFGLPSAATGAIAAALPALLQKFAHKAQDPNDSSINLDSVKNSLGSEGGALGSILKGF
ncbi:MAG: hypothetical protein JWQ25_368 [Daejeonella sp.]|nr:hypothetical protein [Daejeonella sp.]